MNIPPMFEVLEQSILDPEDETFVIDIQDEEDLGGRTKRAPEMGDFWATRCLKKCIFRSVPDLYASSYVA